jgi:hypothetical protein
MRVSRITSAPPAVARTASASKALGRGGSVSRMSRWSVQSPPFSTDVGMPGSGVIDPNAPPPPANANAVT